MQNGAICKLCRCCFCFALPRCCNPKIHKPPHDTELPPPASAQDRTCHRLRPPPINAAVNSMRITTEPTWHHHHHHGWAKWLQKRPRPHIDSPHSDCSEYLANPGNRRHTVQEFFAMVSKTAKVEAQYVERLKCSFPDIERMQSQGFGDISFNGDRRVDAELKLVDKRKTGSHAQFRCKMYRIHHVIDKCVREASAVF